MGSLWVPTPQPPQSPRGYRALSAPQLDSPRVAGSLHILSVGHSQATDGCQLVNNDTGDVSKSAEELRIFAPCGLGS